jgi:glycosyltransferase involved in cell wall biosynthesis
MKGFKNSVLERSYKLEIVGMAEKDYLKKLLRLKQEIKSKAEFPGPVFDLTKKIQKIDSVDFVVLPSLFEPFGIVFLESMARGKIVIATKTKGAQELILNNETGLLFDIKNNLQLSEIFNKISSKEFNKQKKLIQKNAMKFAEGFKVSNLIKKWEELF